MDGLDGLFADVGELHHLKTRVDELNELLDRFTNSEPPEGRMLVCISEGKKLEKMLVDFSAAQEIRAAVIKSILRDLHTVEARMQRTFEQVRNSVLA